MQPDEFKAIRKGLGLTQSGLARVLGLGLTWISQTELGHAPIEPRTDLAMRYLAEHPEEVAARSTAA